MIDFIQFEDLFDSVDFKGNYLESFTRYNSGKHLLDSGDYYGRQYERSVSDQDFYFDEYSGFIINCHEMIRQNFEHLYKVQYMFNQFEKLEENEDLHWFKLTEKFTNLLIEQYGFNSDECRDNTYNSENDLDQDMIVQVLTNNRDWIYNDGESIMVIHFHTGCDIRGGYSPPLFVKSKHDYNWPLVRARLSLHDVETLEWIDNYEFQELNNYQLIDEFEILNSSDINNVKVKHKVSEQEYIVSAYYEI